MNITLVFDKILDKIDYIGEKRNMKPSDIQALKDSITKIREQEKENKKEREYGYDW